MVTFHLRVASSYSKNSQRGFPVWLNSSSLLRRMPKPSVPRRITAHTLRNINININNNNNTNINTNNTNNA